MWLQEKRDPAKEWLQLNYCVTMQDIQMEVQEWSEEWKVPMIPKTVPGGQTRMQDRTVPVQQTGTNDVRKKKKMTQGQEGGSSPIQKKSRTKKKSQVWFYTRTTVHRTGTKRNDRTVCTQKKYKQRQEISMEEEMVQDTGMDT
jgi:hypothetical protein